MPGARPVTIGIHGVQHTFEPGDKVVASRFEPIYNHPQQETDTHITRIYDFPKLCIYLAGIILPGYSIDEENWTLSTKMRDEFGWNADLELTDYMSEYIKERYIRLGSKSLEAKGFPETWIGK